MLLHHRGLLLLIDLVGFGLAVVVDGGAFLGLFVHVELVTLLTILVVTLQIVAIALIFCKGGHSTLLLRLRLLRKGQQRGIY